MEQPKTKLKAVLVVEDNDEIRETLSFVLATSGFNVCSAGNGLEALHVLDRSSEPMLIFLDLMMPLMDGWTFLKALAENERYAGLPVVVTSTAAKQVNSPNVVAMLPKPYDLDEILKLADTYCVHR